MARVPVREPGPRPQRESTSATPSTGTAPPGRPITPAAPAVTPTEPAIPVPTIRRPPWFLALIPAAVALVLYLITCSPTVNFLDSGELTTVAWTAGVAHPPGYPLYTLISILFIHLPLGDPAWRMNVLSALFAALAVGLFYGLVADTLAGMPAFLRAVARRESPARSSGARSAPSARSSRPASASAQGRDKTGRPSPPPKERLAAAGGPPAAVRAVQPVAVVSEDPALAWAAAAAGLAASGLLAVSLTFWNWATQAKMYSLHFAFMAGLLWLALRTRRALYADAAANAPPVPRWPPRAWSPAIRLLHLLALVAGLSMTNHYLSNLLWVGIAILLLAPIGRAGVAWGRIFRHAGTVLIAGLAPLLLYLYLPIRSGMGPLLDWGSPDSWGDFWRQVTVWQFRVYIGQDAGHLSDAVADAFVFAANQFGPWLSLLLLVPIGAGLAYLWRTDRGLLAATIVTALIDIIYTLNYQIREVVVYYIPFYMIALWWAGLGVGQGILWARDRLPALRSGARASRPAVLFALGGLLPLLALLINWGAAGHQDDHTADLFVRNAFKNFRPNAVVLTNSWDLVSGSYYLQHILGERPDVAIIDKELLRYPFYVNYVARSYPDLVGKIAQQYAAYTALDRTWVDTGQAGNVATLYSQVLNGFVDSNLGSRPVYLVFGNKGSEEQDVLSKHQAALVPDGLGYRVAAGPDDKATADPQFDLRGLTSDRVPLDEVAYSVIWMYPQALGDIGAYLSANGATAAQKTLGTQLQAQAQSLAWLASNPTSRPHLR